MYIDWCLIKKSKIISFWIYSIDFQTKNEGDRLHNKHDRIIVRTAKSAKTKMVKIQPLVDYFKRRVLYIGRGIYSNLKSKILEIFLS